MMFKRIDHVEIVPKNIDETIAFYTDILGFKIKERNKMNMPGLTEISYLTLGDTMIELLAFNNPAPAPEGPTLGYRIMAIEVEDMDKAIEFLKSKGVQISRPPMNLGKSKRAEMKDPSGFTIELRQW
jgi:catechol 2,3-dioxygenase-like lactoylglutathione lyase family enzyme